MHGLPLALFQHGEGQEISAEAVRDQVRDVLHLEFNKEVPVLFDDGETQDHLVDAGIKMLTVFFEKVQLPDKVLA